MVNETYNTNSTGIYGIHGISYVYSRKGCVVHNYVYEIQGVRDEDRGAR